MDNKEVTTYQERRADWLLFWADAYATGSIEEIRFLNSAFNEVEYDKVKAETES